MNKSQQGYIALIVLLIVSAIGVSVSISLLLLSLGSSRSSLTLVDSSIANSLAHTCAEEALQEIRDLVAFSGTNTLTIGNGSCTYTVALGSAEERIITASGSYGSVIRRVEVLVNSITPVITIGSWDEVANF